VGITLQGGTLVLSGSNNYTGPTTVNNNAILSYATSESLKNSSGAPNPSPIIDNGTLDFATPGTFASPIIGTGGITVEAGTGVVILSGAVSYQGPTVVNTGTLELDNFTNLVGDVDLVQSTSIIDFNPPKDAVAVVSGKIFGLGAVQINGNGGEGIVAPTNPLNAYVGTTSVFGGTLYYKNLVGMTAGDLIVKAPGTLVLDETESHVFTNNLLGDGTFMKEGSGILSMGIDELDFSGVSIIEAGNLIVDNQMGGSMIVRKNGALVGMGSILQDLQVKDSGSVIPGNNKIATFHVGGNYRQSDDSTYFVKANLNPDGTLVNSLIDVDGSATIVSLSSVVSTSTIRQETENQQISLADGPKVHVDLSAPGQLGLGEVAKSPILHADGGVSGTYAAVIASFPLLSPFLTYDANNVYLNLINTFAILPGTFNEKQVGIQLQKFNNPTPDEQSLLSEIAALPREKGQKVLDQLSGEQYASTLLVAELSNRNFSKRLFNPVRSILGSPYQPSCSFAHELAFDAWCEASIGHTKLQTGKNFHKVDINSSEFSLGGHVLVFDNFILGGAYSHVEDRLGYHVGGHGMAKANLGGLYALFRPNAFYAFTTFVAGKSHNLITREIDIGTKRFKPHGHHKSLQGSYYVEAGRDFIWNYVLAQPFLGFEGGHYRFDAFNERGGSPFALAFDEKKVTPAYTRVGVHLTTRSRPLKLSFGADFAWSYRLGSSCASIREKFVAFGDPFKIKGPHLHHNCLEASLNGSFYFLENWQLDAQAMTETWANAMTYSFLFGIKGNW